MQVTSNLSLSTGSQRSVGVYDERMTKTYDEPHEEPATPSHFTDENHALAAGMLWGLFMKAGIVALPLADEAGNYTDVIEIRFPGLNGETKAVQVRVLPCS